MDEPVTSWPSWLRTAVPDNSKKSIRRVTSDVTGPGQDRGWLLWWFSDGRNQVFDLPVCYFRPFPVRRARMSYRNLTMGVVVVDESAQPGDKAQQTRDFRRFAAVSAVCMVGIC